MGLLLVYWIGKYFYKLAEEYKKNKWGFALLGVAVYYGGTLFFAFFFGLFGALIAPEIFDDFNEFAFGLLMIPLGLLISYLHFNYLKKKWKKETPDILDLLDTFGTEEKEESNNAENV